MFQIDDSSLESHMPQAVLTALKMLKKQIEEERRSEPPQEPEDCIELQGVKVVATDPMTDDVNTPQTSLVLDAEVHC